MDHRIQGVGIRAVGTRAGDIPGAGIRARVLTNTKGGRGSQASAAIPR
jgi:hypothetical protein